MGEENSVNWFEVKQDPMHLRILKWIVAVLAALLLNWAYINGLPVTHGYEILSASEPKGDELTIEMMDELEEMQYVETNPDAVENEPDKTPNISNRNQQSAQENVAGPAQESNPFVEGDDEESPKILEGEIPVDGEDAPAIQTVTQESSNRPQPEQEAREASQAMRRQQQAMEQPQEEQQEQQPTPEVMPSMEAPSSLEDLPAIPPPPPTPDFIEKEEPQPGDGVTVPMIEAPEEPVMQYSQQMGEDKTLNINIPPSVAQQLSKAQEELKKQQQQQKQQPDQQAQTAQQPVKPQPMPRPRLSPKVLPGPLLASQTYAARMGEIAVDAKFNQFGYYLQRMFETIQLQWYSLLNDVTIGQEHRPAYAVIEYDLNTEGKVVATRVLDSNAGDLATLLCKDAIESRAPFGPWTRQMVDQLGEQQTIRVKFIYL